MEDTMEDTMTEMEMLRELRSIVAHMVGSTGGNREKVKSELREELVSAVKERFGLGTWTPIRRGR